MKQLYFFLILFYIISNSLYAQQTTDESAALQNRIIKIENSLKSLSHPNVTLRTIQEQMKAYHIPGVSIAVIHNYKIEYAKGYGFSDKGAKKEVNTETLFHAASLSKTLNAAGVMKLVDSKKLDLDKDINDCLVSWKFPYNLKKGKKNNNF